MAMSGQKTVTTAGIAVQLGTQSIQGPLLIKALDTNTGVVAVGNVSEDVTVSNGLRLLKGESIEFGWVGNLATILLDSAANGEGVSWIMLSL